MRKVYRIKPVSKKRARENRTYTKLRKDFIRKNEDCQASLPGCSVTTTDVHHKAGRIGDKLIDTSDWLAVCRCCHSWIEVHPKEAKEMGLSKSRLNKAS